MSFSMKLPATLLLSFHRSNPSLFQFPPTSLLAPSSPPPPPVLPLHQLPVSSLIPSSDSVGVPSSPHSLLSVDNDFSNSPDHFSAPPSAPTTEAITSFFDTTDLPSSSTPPPLPSFEEPVNPKYRSLHDVYSTSNPTESVPSSPLTSYANMIHAAETYREPATYKQATMSPQAAYWKTTMEKEYDSLMENNTWILVPPPWSQHHSMQMGLPHQIHFHWHHRQVQSSPCRQRL